MICHKSLKAKSEEKMKRKQAAAAARAERKKQRASRSKGGHLVYVKEPEGYVRQGRHGKSLVLQGSQVDKSKIYCGYYTRYGKWPYTMFSKYYTHQYNTVQFFEKENARMAKSVHLSMIDLIEPSVQDTSKRNVPNQHICACYPTVLYQKSCLIALTSKEVNASE
jgi:hypothetical protein